MKILVTGATGLVGGNLTRILVKKGFDVRVLVRDSSNLMAIEGLEIEKTNGDIRDLDSLKHAMKDVRRVYHCAAMVSMWVSDVGVMRDINVNGTINVMNAAMDVDVERLVYVSTVDALGLRTEEEPADESVPFNEEGRATPYARTKYEAQGKVMGFAEKGLDVIIVNPTYMIGPFDVKPSSGRMIVEVARGRAVGYPGGGNNFVDVQDVVEGMISAMEKGKRGEMYILGHENLSYKEMFTRIARVVGAKPPRVLIPYPIAWLGGIIGGIYGYISRMEPNLNPATARMGYVPHYFSARKAVRELNLPQTPIDRAIKRAYTWFVENGYLKEVRS